MSTLLTVGDGAPVAQVGGVTDHHRILVKLRMQRVHHVELLG